MLVPNSVAGAAPGNTLKSAGTRINPPPPTMASTNPANSEASVTVARSSMRRGGNGVAHDAWTHARPDEEERHK
ncbi:hypothetical protein [Methylibium sp. T29-B]|uniref:hypothetical protein n=1 Tax=Methylibium sp. T29-B TaxID=1437443 RepID=UPI001E32F9BA|nr:hypothetical protein [Methylibium sp. T29-B]